MLNVAIVHASKATESLNDMQFYNALFVKTVCFDYERMRLFKRTFSIPIHSRSRSIPNYSTYPSYPDNESTPVTTDSEISKQSLRGKLPPLLQIRAGSKQSSKEPKDSQLPFSSLTKV